MNSRNWILLTLLVPIVFVAGCSTTLLSEKLESRGHGVPMGEDTFVYRVYLPPGYEQHPERRYPLLVWFHGGGSNEKSWGKEGGIGVNLLKPTTSGELEPFIVLSPTPGDFEIYKGQTEAALVEKVLPRVNREYRTNGVTVAMGHSLGGLNALIVSLRHPTLFSAVAVASPFVFDTTPFDSRDQLESFEKEFGAGWQGVYRRAVGARFETREQFEEFDPFSNIRTAKELPFKLYLTCGTEDGFGLFPHVEFLHKTLAQSGLEHEWVVQNGVGHSTARGPEIFNWLGRQAQQAEVERKVPVMTATRSGGGR